jgi:hypothetical protein
MLHSLPPPFVTSFIITLVFPLILLPFYIFPHSTVMAWLSRVSILYYFQFSRHLCFHNVCHYVTNFSIEVLPLSFLENIGPVPHSSLNYVSHPQLFTISLSTKMVEKPPCIIPFVDRKGPYSRDRQQHCSHPSSWNLLQK